MIQIKWRFEKLEKTEVVDENYIFPTYGDKVNHFNEFLKVVDVECKQNVYYITLKSF